EKAMIVVIGATGNVGSEVVRQLAEKGEKVRALVRSPEKAEKLKRPNVELFKGDLHSAESLRAALQGADHLFLLATGFDGMEKGEPKAIDEAKKAGVKHVVYLSVIGADMEPGGSIGRAHRASEKLLEASGLTWTFIRPSGFMSNQLNNAGSIKAQ